MSQSSHQNSFTDKKNIMWVLLSGAMAILFVILLFVPGGSQNDSLFSVYSAMIWCGLFGGALFRYLDKNGWVGFAIGSVAGMCIQIFSQIAMV
ncbi:hypothetical protein [Alteromonas sp. C1M14]|uniref:hypothetical protein n=1 Tax=Alteromonas sp. C1M14 TaxID=2841567 RepID=UPI001C08D85A|nr:hypothetical protein [Alteromonas sp. C1M14]MBU2978399.1 hypothetical protein [Alteromonas sp. C1M14]